MNAALSLESGHDFPAGSVHSSYHTPQHCRHRDTTLDLACDIKSTLLVRDQGIFSHGNLGFFWFGTLVFRYSLSRSAFRRSIFKLGPAGERLKFWSVSRSGLRRKAEFSLWMPFSLMSWNAASSVITRGKVGPHTFSTGTGFELVRTFWNTVFCRSQHRCWICPSPADPSHRNPKWKKCVSLGFYCRPVACFLPVPRFTHLGLFSLSSLPVPHYRRDNHRFHNTRETRPLHKLSTRRSQAFIILPAVTPINLYGLVIIWPFQLTVFPKFSDAAVKDFYTDVCEKYGFNSGC